VFQNCISQKNKEVEEMLSGIDRHSSSQYGAPVGGVMCDKSRGLILWLSGCSLLQPKKGFRK